MNTKELSFRDHPVAEAIGVDIDALKIALGALFRRKERNEWLISIGLFAFLSLCVRDQKWLMIPITTVVATILRVRPEGVTESPDEIINLLVSENLLNRNGTNLVPSKQLLQKLLDAPGFVIGPPPKEEEPPK